MIPRKKLLSKLWQKQKREAKLILGVALLILAYFYIQYGVIEWILVVELYLINTVLNIFMIIKMHKAKEAYLTDCVTEELARRAKVQEKANEIERKNNEFLNKK